MQAAALVVDFAQERLAAWDEAVGASHALDAALRGVPAWQVLILGALIWTSLSWLYGVLVQRVPLSVRMRRAFFAFLRTNSLTRRAIDKEIDSQLDKSHLPFASEPNELSFHSLPARGLARNDVLRLCKERAQQGHYDWRNGRASGAVYCEDDEAWSQFMSDVMRNYLWSNPLHSDIFPGVRKMEAEVVSMTLNMFHGGPDSAGAMTSGGTESILMAMKAYRDRGFDRGIRAPELVLPSSAHVAFDKAAGYFGLHVVHVPVDPNTGRADVRAMRAAITRSTVCIVGSAPSYPHGVIDPISELSDLAEEFGVGLHVDSCLGGFIVPFAEEAGFPLPPFDFRLSGVSSISADTHKYGYAVKGSSVIMFSTGALRRYMYFVQPDWCGGIYASPSLQGSRCGAVIAAAWAAMVARGRAGYVDATRRIMSAAKQFEADVRATDGLFVYGAADTTCVAFSSNVFNIYALGARLSKLGWNLSSMQRPPAVHISLTLRHTKPGVMEALVRDLRRETAELRSQPGVAASEASAAIYGMAETIPDASLISVFAQHYIDASYRVDTHMKAHVTQANQDE